MMNKSPLFALAMSPLMCGSAWATCSQIPLNVRDANNNVVAMSSATAGDSNCKTYIDEDTASQFHSDLTSPIPAGTNLIGKVGVDQTTPGVTNGVVVTTALPAGTNVIGFSSNDPCAQKTKTNVSFGQQATTVQLVAGVSGQKIYVCSFVAVFPAAAVLNIIEGTGATCVTSNELAVVGSTTAALGLSFAANGGYSQGGGNGSVMVTTNASSGLCLLLSANNTASGNLTYVQQ